MAKQPPNRNDDRGKEEYRDGFQVAKSPLEYEQAAVPRPLPPPPPFSYFRFTDPTNPNRATPAFQSIEEDGPNSNQAWHRHRDLYCEVIEESKSIGRLEWLFGFEQKLLGGYSSHAMARNILNRLVDLILFGMQNLYDWVPHFLGYGQRAPYLEAFFSQSQSQSQAASSSSSSSSSRAARGRGC
ncbi:hypothetical protein V2J09_016583 [Rumex salicifolius]